MFQILTMTEALLATLTSRSEHHGDDEVPALSLCIEMTVGNDLLDVIDPDLRPTFWKPPEGQATLPGVSQALTVLRCNSIDRVTLPMKHDGWTLNVDDGIDDTQPRTFGSCKVDKVSVEPMQGGSCVLRMRVGTSDIDADRAGFLQMRLRQPIWITLIAPKPGEEKPKEEPKKKPDATDLFAAKACEQCGGTMGETENAEGDVYLRCESCGWTPPATESEGGETDVGSGETEGASSETEAASAATNTAPRATLSPEAAWPFPKNQVSDSGAPPQHLTEPKVSKASRKRAKAGAEA